MSCPVGQPTLSSPILQGFPAKMWPFIYYSFTVLPFFVNENNDYTELKAFYFRKVSYFYWLIYVLYSVVLFWLNVQINIALKGAIEKLNSIICSQLNNDRYVFSWTDIYENNNSWFKKL